MVWTQLRSRARDARHQVALAMAMEPAAWRPPRATGLTGVYTGNTALAGAEHWDTGGIGPEDVVVDGQGRAHVGVADGRILRFPPGGGPPEQLANTRGRPLGLELDGRGRLIICDAQRGLLRLDGRGELSCLVDSWQGRALRFTNNAAVARDGTIYFSDSSTEFGISDYRADLLAHRPLGRLFAHRPDTGETRLIAEGLFFANGVTLSADESFVLVAETSAYRITRLWLKGERVGTRDFFAENLPGFPDNLSANGRGIIWAAFPTPRDRALDFLLPRPRLRKLVALLPERFQPRPARHGMVIGFDEQGRVAHNLQDSSGRCAMVTGAREHDGWLYLGSLTEPTLVRYRLPV